MVCVFLFRSQDGEGGILIVTDRFAIVQWLLRCIFSDLVIDLSYIFFLVQLCCILSPSMSTAMAALGAKPDSHYLSFDTLLLQLHSTIK